MKTNQVIGNAAPIKVPALMVEENPAASQVCLAIWISPTWWTAWVLREADFYAYVKPIVEHGPDEGGKIALIETCEAIGTPLTRYQAACTFPLYASVKPSHVAEIIQ